MADALVIKRNVNQMLRIRRPDKKKGQDLLQSASSMKRLYIIYTFV